MTGDEFKELREGYDLTQVELANMLGVSQPAISNWETDGNEVPMIVRWIMRRRKVVKMLRSDPAGELRI